MDIFTKENIRLDCVASDKGAALASIAAFTVERGYSGEAEGVFVGLREREEQMSTALMDGIAIPHTKHAAVDSAAVLIQRFNEPIHWSDQAIKVTLAMLVPEDGGSNHLALLAQVSRTLIDDEVRAALNSSDEETIFQIFNNKLN